jgi:hypothetical protein
MKSSIVSSRRALGWILTVACASLLSSCGSGGGSSVPEGRVAQPIGPTGGVIDGPAGTPLQGLRIVIPKDALQAFVDVTLVASDPIELVGHQPVGAAFELRMDPDPGRLRVPIEIRSLVDAPRFRSPDDFLMLRRDELLDWKGQPLQTAVTALGPTGGLDQERRFYRARAFHSGRFQVFVVESPRSLTDAVALVAKGLSEIESFDRRSLERGLDFFRQSLLADPHQHEGRFYAALCKLALLLDDRSDTSAGIDSLGELLESFGVRLETQGVLERLFADDWPSYSALPISAPQLSDVLSFYEGKLRPALLETRAELLRVSGEFSSSLTPPDFFKTGNPARRELDYGDLVMARAMVEGLLFQADYWLGYEWGNDLQSLSRVRSSAELQRLPRSVGLVGRNLLDRAALHLELALRFYAEAHRSIALETDSQSNDALVFRSSLDARERDELLSWMERIRNNLRSGEAERVRVPRQEGQLNVRLRAMFDGQGLPLRQLLPGFTGWVPLGRSVPDATGAGLFPGMSQDEAIQRAMIPTRAVLAAATIQVDGAIGDWPQGSELLDPEDPRGDAKAYGELSAIDAVQVHMAADGDFVYFRIDLDDDAFAYRAGQAVIYELAGRDHTGDWNEGTPFSLQIRFDSASPTARFVQGSKAPLTVPFAYTGKTLECAVPRKSIAGELVERRISLRIRALDLGNGRSGGDDTRAVILRF